MERLGGATKHYVWGSSAAIQEYSGHGRPGELLAEVWWGTSGPAVIDDGRSLAEPSEGQPAVLGGAAALRSTGVSQPPFESMALGARRVGDGPVWSAARIYLSGLALEVMANSDNAFRLGLTSKPVDVDEAVRNLITEPVEPCRPHGIAGSRAPGEFRLDAFRPGDERQVGGIGPRILVARGDCRLRDHARLLALSRGEAVFIEGGEEVIAHGDANVAVVSVPESGDQTG